MPGRAGRREDAVAVSHPVGRRLARACSTAGAAGGGLVMSITFACTNPKCKKALKAKDELAGKKLKCSGCGTVVSVPKEEGVQAGGPAPAKTGASPAQTAGAQGGPPPKRAPLPGKSPARPPQKPAPPGATRPPSRPPRSPPPASRRPRPPTSPISNSS